MPAGARPPIPPTFCKIEYQGTILGHQWRNVAYAALGGSSITSTDLNTLSTTISTSWNTRFAALLCPDCILTGIKLVYVPSVGNEIVGVNTTSHPGTRAATTIQDASASFLVNWNVNKYYRGGHPRWYLPGVAQTDTTNGSLIIGTSRTAIATDANGHLNDVNAATTTNITAVTLGTLSWVHNNAWRTPPIHFPFVSASGGQFMATQRRRIHS